MANKYDTYPETVGMTVRRIIGRPQNIGLTGIIVWASDPETIGTGGDVLVKVRQDDGAIFMCYSRQLEEVK